tara:strand:- start:443 stop:727 length:285 start_codon:yes stop_codon:yes gene_type:complete
LVWKARISISVAQTRAHAQASIGGDEAVGAFNDFRDLISGEDKKKGREEEQMRERLEDLKKVEAIKFRPDPGATRIKTPKVKKVRRKDLFPRRK